MTSTKLVCLFALLSVTFADAGCSIGDVTTDYVPTVTNGFIVKHAGPGGANGVYTYPMSPNEQEATWPRALDQVPKGVPTFYGSPTEGDDTFDPSDLTYLEDGEHITLYCNSGFIGELAANTGGAQNPQTALAYSDGHGLNLLCEQGNIQLRNWRTPDGTVYDSTGDTPKVKDWTLLSTWKWGVDAPIEGTTYFDATGSQTPSATSPLGDLFTGLCSTPCQEITKVVGGVNGTPNPPPVKCVQPSNSSFQEQDRSCNDGFAIYRTSENDKCLSCTALDGERNDILEDRYTDVPTVDFATSGGTRLGMIKGIVRSMCESAPSSGDDSGSAPSSGGGGLAAKYILLFVGSFIVLTAFVALGLYMAGCIGTKAGGEVSALPTKAPVKAVEFTTSQETA